MTLVASFAPVPALAEMVEEPVPQAETETSTAVTNANASDEYVQQTAPSPDELGSATSQEPSAQQNEEVLPLAEDDAQLDSELADAVAKVADEVRGVTTTAIGTASQNNNEDASGTEPSFFNRLAVSTLYARFAYVDLGDAAGRSLRERTLAALNLETSDRKGVTYAFALVARELGVECDLARAENVEPGNGALENGASGNGAQGSVEPGNGALENGASENVEPQNDATQDGVSEDGALVWNVVRIDDTWLHVDAASESADRTHAWEEEDKSLPASEAIESAERVWTKATWLLLDDEQLASLDARRARWTRDDNIDLGTQTAADGVGADEGANGDSGSNSADQGAATNEDGTDVGRTTVDATANDVTVAAASGADVIEPDAANDVATGASEDAADANKAGTDGEGAADANAPNAPEPDATTPDRDATDAPEASETATEPTEAPEAAKAKAEAAAAADAAKEQSRSKQTTPSANGARSGSNSTAKPSQSSPRSATNPTTDTSTSSGKSAANSVVGLSAQASATTPESYSYTVQPLLAPFNEMIYVKTSNPDPTSFQFIDLTTKYDTSDSPAVFTQTDHTFLDVVYEKASTRRVKGGYLFYSSYVNSDGGKLTLQVKDANGRFVNTKKTVTCPAMKSYIDYLIDTYASGTSGFFNKMDAVQNGLDAIAAYPMGVFDESKPSQDFPYPFLAASPYRELDLNDHLEMYEYSEEGMLLTWAYPYVLDSLGFPSVMGSVAKKLDSSASVKWNSNLHWLVDVTYNGETRSYGGAGSHGGSDDRACFSSRIEKLYKFDGSANDYYGASLNKMYNKRMEMGRQASEDSKEYAEQISGSRIAATVRPGAWLRVEREGWGYAREYAYALADADYGYVSYASDCWVDGRYVSAWETYVPNATFGEHPTADIVVRNMTYTDHDGTQHTKDVRFAYDDTSNTWIADGYYAASWELSYYGWLLPDEFVLTADEVRAMGVDKNTGTLPHEGFIYDGKDVPGTPFTTVHVSGVTLPKTATVCVNGYIELSPTVLPASAACNRVTWSSSNEAVATVDEYGNVRGVKVGTATITAKTVEGGYTASCKVTVTKPTTGITISASSLELKVGQTKQLTATVTPKDACQTVTWSTYYSGLSVDSTGKVKGLSVGAYGWVTASTSDGRTANCYVYVTGTSIAKAKVTAPAQKYTGSALKPAPTVVLGKTTLKRGTDYTVSYKNNVKAGTATITITGKGKYEGTATGTFRIVGTSVAKAKIAAVTNQAYTGKAVKPKPKVTLGGKTLKAGTDFDYAYRNNTKAGTATVVVKGKGAYEGTAQRTFKIVAPSVSYRTHIQGIGNQEWKKNGQVSGTSGESRRLEGIWIKLGSKPVTGSIQYRTHIQGIGWQGWRNEGKMSGTSGQSKRLEAIRIRLTGNMAKKYDVYYRVHAQRLGWMGWAKNGADAGTAGYSYRLEAIQIKLVPKGAAAPGKTTGAFVQR
ncbi:MAG: Ig-like domain-containing protein [Atopobiaceae bacterium]|nr:Ig-like domain-containing protein [Atopobiaceae bacterium]